MNLPFVDPVRVWRLCLGTCRTASIVQVND